MVVEDEYWTAMDMATELETRGAVVAGPLASVSEAVTLLCGQDRPDAAILDVNLRGMEVFVLADILKAQHIPFVFATGYQRSIMPPRFADVPHFEKPMVVPGCIEAALALAADRTSRNQPTSG
jgi:CheY-like chemotaxis protein